MIIAEDDPDDRLLIKDAIKEAGQEKIEVDFVQDGAELLDYLHRRGSYTGAAHTAQPELVMMDLNMPRKGGLEALEEIKLDPALRAIPVVVLSTSHSPEHIARSYELGGAGFLTKPGSFTELVELMRSVEVYWFRTVRLP